MSGELTILTDLNPTDLRKALEAEDNYDSSEDHGEWDESQWINIADESSDES